MSADRHDSRDNSSAIRSDESAQLRARQPWNKPTVVLASAERTEKVIFGTDSTVRSGGASS
jgi:hypothetical protein